MCKADTGKWLGPKVESARVTEKHVRSTFAVSLLCYSPAMERTKVAFVSAGQRASKPQVRFALFEFPDPQGQHLNGFRKTVNGVARAVGAYSPSALQLSLDSNGEEVVDSDIAYHMLRQWRKNASADDFEVDENQRPTLFYNILPVCRRRRRRLCHFG